MVHALHARPVGRRQNLQIVKVIYDFNREAIDMEIDFSLPSERVTRELKQIVSWRGKPQVIRCDNGPDTSVQRSRTGHLSGVCDWNISSRATRSRMLMSSGSTGRYGKSGCHRTLGMTWQRSKTLQQSGCGLTTMAAPTWPWTDLHQSSDWPWVRHVSTSATLAKGDDYRAREHRFTYHRPNKCHFLNTAV